MAVSAIGHDLEERGLSINIGKSYAMFIAPSSTDCFGVCISMDSFHLSTVSSARLLGVVIDNKLIWD